jgi:formamidopyrimidine-DNA glycosylase
MPELPEVEILVRHLSPLLKGGVVREATVRRRKVLGATSEKEFRNTLLGAKFKDITRRGKYILFSLAKPGVKETILMVGHLGMTGRMYLAARDLEYPKHAAVVLHLGPKNFIFEDTRYFGRMTLDTIAITKLGPEPLGGEFTAEYLKHSLSRTRRPVKIKLLDQSLVAGIGNIYAAEALFEAGIHPESISSQLSGPQIHRLHRAIRNTLESAIKLGRELSLDFVGTSKNDGLFYFGGREGGAQQWEERFAVYDRLGQPCRKCGSLIRRIIQAARSTYFCPICQKDTRPTLKKS